MLKFQGLLALEGELTPILVQMVKSANMNGLLDNEGDTLSDCQQKWVTFRMQEYYFDYFLFVTMSCHIYFILFCSFYSSFTCLVFFTVSWTVKTIIVYERCSLRTYYPWWFFLPALFIILASHICVWKILRNTCLLRKYRVINTL